MDAYLRVQSEATVTDVLLSLAKEVFTALLLTKIIEALDRAGRYG